MSSKQIPVQPSRTGDQAIDGPIRTLAANMNKLIGAELKSERLTELAADASLADVIKAVNIIIRRLA